MRRVCAAAEVLSKEFGDKPENIGGRRGLQEGPADSLQMNSNLLQRNSNITAIEFQQFHPRFPEVVLQRVKSQSNAASGDISSSQVWRANRAIDFQTDTPNGRGVTSAGLKSKHIRPKFKK